MGRSRKKQTTLSFNPMPSSSPAAKEYNKQVQDRAAAVTYDGASDMAQWRNSRSSRRNKEAGSSENGGVNSNLPTPAATMERVEEENSSGSDNDSEPVRSSQRQSNSAGPSTSTAAASSSRKQPRQRQQAIDFSRARDADSFDAPITLTSSALSPNPTSSGMFASQKRKRGVVEVSSDDEDSESLAAPEDIVKKSKKSKKEAKAAKRKERRNRKTQQAETIELEDDEEDVIKKPANRPVVVEDDDSDDDMPTTLGKQSRKRKVSRSSPLSSSPPRAVESDDDLTIIERPKKRRRQESDEEEEDEEDELPKTPRRRTLQRKRQLTQQDEEDLNEDLEFLEPSSESDSSRRPRDSQSVKKNARLNALEILKRKRAGQTEELEEPEGILGYKDDGTGEQDEEDEEPEEQEEDDMPHASSSRSMFRATQDDDDFIDEDDEEETTLGVPEGIPIEYTRYASMKAKDLFKYAVEWMVHKKINPAFDMDDPLYNLTFKKLNDEVQGLAGSKFRSAAWTPEFTLAVTARPEIAIEALDQYSSDIFGRDKCDACNRSGHPATYQVQFSGNPYYPETLEDVSAPDEDDSSDSDSDSDNEGESNNEHNHPTKDAQGRDIAPVNRAYFVGKFCMANASTAHSLQHWRYHLYDYVFTWLTREGYNSAAAIVERDQMKAKKRGKLANKIVDRMGSEGVIRDVWREFRNNIDEARNSKQGRFETYGSP